MSEIFLALQRSVTTLGRGRVWLYFFGPAVFALLLLIVFSAYALDYLVATFLTQPPITWVSAWGAEWLAGVLATIGGWLLVLSASYMVAMLLTAVVVLPLLLNHLAATDYADLARQGHDSVFAGVWNSLSAAALFLLGWLLTMPLWLIPGGALLLPLYWMAWLNRRTFAYDALAVHAADDEWRALRQRHGWSLLGLGLLLSLLAYVPFMGLLAPSLAALAYLHYCLEALRRLRQGAVVSVQSARR